MDPHLIILTRQNPPRMFPSLLPLKVCKEQTEKSLSKAGQPLLCPAGSIWGRQPPRLKAAGSRHANTAQP